MLQAYSDNLLPHEFNIRIVRSLRSYCEDILDGNDGQKQQAFYAINVLCELLSNCLNTEIPEYEREIWQKIFATIGNKIEEKSRDEINSYVRELYKIEKLFQ